ncbi:XF1762 family protein [Kytococcus sedentarius]|uniref:XF1762 family protein n=1 Tax=Kytococcus sedentarius TaxID=1276 RepID=UPI003879CC08
MSSSRLHVIPLELSEANRIVAAWHRHHQPSQGHRFSLGAIDNDGVIHGAAIIGRPVARLAGTPRDVLEVVRLVTDGHPNACSILYAAAARAGTAMGYRRIQTYILDSERGTSVKASGWDYEGVAGGGQWKHTDGKPRRTDQPTTPKGRWAKALANRPDPDLLTIPETPDEDPSLFGATP